MNGTVKFFNVMKNFGFIEPADKSKDVFVHSSDITSGPITEGDSVEFDVESTDRGNKAVNVVKIS